MYFKMMMPYIIMGVSLVVLSKASEEENLFKEKKLFLQYKHSSEASGWYKRRDGGYYKRDQNFSRATYYFERSDNVWRLSALPRNGNVFQMKTIYSTEQSKKSLEQVNFTNYLPTLEYRLPQLRFHPNETLQSLVNGKNKQKNRKNEHLNDRYKNDLEDLSMENGLYESVNENYEDILKIFTPKKCSCTKVEVRRNGNSLGMYYRSDINRNLSDRCNVSIEQEYSIENRNLSLNDTNDTPSDKHSEKWKEKIHVSNGCQQIYFDTDDDKWVAELKSFCSPQDGGIFSSIWSEDSAPCIEYLPPPEKQTWLYYSSLTVFDNKENLDSIYIEDCGGYFKKSIYENFTVTCVSMTDHLN